MRDYADAYLDSQKRVIELESAIRRHRDERGDDRCHRDDDELYAILPEGWTPRDFDTAVELEHCKRYIACRQNPATEYVSPQRRIEELEAELELADAVFDITNKAHLRGIKMWREATGRDKDWPETADLTMWLISRLDGSEKESEQLKSVIDERMEE